jgi:uncharacterized protein
MKGKLAALGVVLMSLGGSLSAQRVSIDAALRTSDESYVEATGEATVSAKPDQVTIDVGVVTEGSTAVAAAGQNARQTDAVLAGLRKLVTGNDQLKTTSYSVQPKYQVAKPGAAPTIASYMATNVVEVVLSDLAQAGKVIDGVLQSGANTIQKVQVGLKNPDAARYQALREAAAKAKAGVEAIAAGLGLHVVRVLSAVEGGEEFGLEKKAAPPPTAAPVTQVEAADVEVTATVTLRVEVAQ